MKEKQLFVLAFVVAASIFTAGRFVDAESEAERTQDPASMSGSVIVDGCRVTAEFIDSTNGMQAVLTATNPTEKDAELELHYAAQRTRNSPMMRMIPTPETRKEGECVLNVPAGKSVSRKFDLGEEAGESFGSAIWTMLIGREKFDKPVFGASISSSAEEVLLPSEGYAVLASLNVERDLTDLDIAQNLIVAQSSESVTL